MNAVELAEFLHKIRRNMRAISKTSFDTGDPDRVQSCFVYVDDIGQPALSYEIIERTKKGAAATKVVQELDNYSVAGRRSLCEERRELLGHAWVAHRTMVPATMLQD